LFLRGWRQDRSTKKKRRRDTVEAVQKGAKGGKGFRKTQEKMSGKYGTKVGGMKMWFKQKKPVALPGWGRGGKEKKWKILPVVVDGTKKERR